MRIEKKGDIKPKKSGSIHEASHVDIEIHKSPTTVTRASIQDTAKELAALAYSAGETNDEEKYAEDMEETIFNAYQELEKEQKERRKKASI